MLTAYIRNVYTLIMNKNEFRQIRGQLDYSQAEIADAVGVTTNTIARWERGEIRIPKMVAKLLQLMAEKAEGPSAITAPVGIARDPYHQSILDALNRHLDPTAFEDCAVDLLRKPWPKLAPVTGGSDYGFDGSLASDGDVRIPLITTTSAYAKVNLRKNLKRVLESGFATRKAIFATPRRITPAMRKALDEIAARQGFSLIEIYDQNWFANALYRDSSWCKKLLSLVGRPTALTIMPLKSGPILGDRVIGRDVELNALRQIERDCVIVGGPGSGKTFLLRAFALEGRGLFLADPESVGLADAIRDQLPAAIIVDDAHVNPQVLLNLRHLRDQIGAEFKIIAVSWPADADRVRVALNMPTKDVIELALLPADTIIKIIKATGIVGPTELLATIRDQAAGRPGLAATLVHMCIEGDARDVWSGDAFSLRVSPVLKDLAGRDPAPVLAVFALAGSRGIAIDVAANILGESPSQISAMLARIGTAGILRDSREHAISIWPEPFRWVLIRDVFFKGPGFLRFEELFESIPDKKEAIIALIGARSRGASVPMLRAYVERENSQDIWKTYAFLGEEEAEHTLKHHPDMVITAARALLTNCPDSTLAVLLEKAIGDDRALHAHTDHPLRKIEDWIGSAGGHKSESIKRRKILLAAVDRWWKADRCKSIPAGNVAIKAIRISFSPKWSLVETDPGQGNSVSFIRGELVGTECDDLKKLWEQYRALIDRGDHTCWRELVSLATEWIHAPLGVRLNDEDYERRKNIGIQIAKDIAPKTLMRPGIQKELASIAIRGRFSIDAQLNPEFEVLFPEDVRNNFEKNQKKWIKNATRLASQWKLLNPEEVARKFSIYENEARLAGISWPRVSTNVSMLIAESIDNPVVWIHAFVSENVRGDLIAPFLTKAISRFSASAEAIIRKFIGMDQYRWLGVEATLTANGMDKRIVQSAVEQAGDYPEMIESLCLRGEVPDGTYEILISGDNLSIALATAIGEWLKCRDGKDAVRQPRRWRDVIVLSASASNLSDKEAYWLSKIFEKSTDIAFDWLVKFVESENSYFRLDFDTAASNAVKVLNDTQRIELLNKTPATAPYVGLLRDIVGDDVDLFRHLLATQNVSVCRLAPLEGKPQGNWAQKIIVAMDAGASAEEILDAIFPLSFGWSGSEAEFWRDWEKSFEPFLSHSDDRVSKIARRCSRKFREKADQSAEKERANAIYGRW